MSNNLDVWTVIVLHKIFNVNQCDVLSFIDAIDFKNIISTNNGYIMAAKLNDMRAKIQDVSGLQVPFDPKIGHFIGPIFWKNRVK